MPTNKLNFFPNRERRQITLNLFIFKNFVISSSLYCKRPIADYLVGHYIKSYCHVSCCSCQREVKGHPVPSSRLPSRRDVPAVYEYIDNLDPIF